jgi:hypothetical protein
MKAYWELEVQIHTLTSTLCTSVPYKIMNISYIENVSCFSAYPVNLLKNIIMNEVDWIQITQDEI